MQKLVNNILQYFFVAIVRLYKLVLSPMMGTNCRFYPTCSDYATEALHIHPPRVALKFIFTRLMACRPFGQEGYDPVPKNHPKELEKTIHV